MSDETTNPNRTTSKKENPLTDMVGSPLPTNPDPDMTCEVIRLPFPITLSEEPAKEVSENDKPLAEDVDQTLDNESIENDLDQLNEEDTDTPEETEEAPTEQATDEPDEEDEEPTLYMQLRDLADLLENGPSPLLKKDSVIIPRDETLDFIESLIAYCPQDGGYIYDDGLIDRLSSDGHVGDNSFMPLHRVKLRAQEIILSAQKEADHIINDAHTLVSKRLQETEDTIKERYDQADLDISERLNDSKEESAKKLSAAREELSTSRQQAVEILNKYMDKAEDDYQGYWERAEKTLLVSLEKSDTALSKAAAIYEKELSVIREDIKTIDEIIKDLIIHRPR